MMKKDLLPYGWRLLPSFLVILALAACSGENQSANNTERVVAVKAMLVQPSDRQLTRTYTGSLEGERQAVLYARLPEAVQEIVSATGRRVKADDIILTLDKYGPSSSYPQAYSVFENARKNFDKMKYLYAQGAISESQHDASRTEFEVTEAQFNSVRRMLELHTPIAGVVTAINVSPGDLVQVGQPLATVATIDRLRVKFAVNSDDIAFVKDGDQIIVRSEGADTPATGQVVRVATSADPDTRSFPVEAIIDNSDGRFNPGMFVHVHYVLQNLSGVIAVPRKAVLTLDNQASVFVVSDKRAELRPVTLGSELSGQVVVTSGLLAGDTLVTLGQDYLENGVALNVTAVEASRP
ncbi:MAG: efflux RND transporter periplasmic adaptor subunit [Candidatus Zixiibacteriota bacterium]